MARPMSTQLEPSASQRCHWGFVLKLGVPDHEPTLPFSSWPTKALPEMLGALSGKELDDASPLFRYGLRYAAVSPGTEELLAAFATRADADGYAKSKSRGA